MKEHSSTTQYNELEIIEPIRVSQKIADQIKKLVFDNKLKPGDRLLPERELSKMLGVGRLSLREGLRILEAMGIVKTTYGVRSGTYVAQIVREKMTDKISDIMRLEKITLDDLFETRIELSLANLKYFIERGNAESMARLGECLEEAKKLLKQGLDPKEKYIEFHRVIALGSGNPVFLLFYHSLLDIIAKEYREKYPCPRSRSKRLLEYNAEILRHLRKKDLKAASATMQKYLPFLKDTISLRVGASKKKIPCRQERLGQPKALKEGKAGPSGPARKENR